MATVDIEPTTFEYHNVEERHNQEILNKSAISIRAVETPRAEGSAPTKKII